MKGGLEFQSFFFPITVSVGHCNIKTDMVLEKELRVIHLDL